MNFSDLSNEEKENLSKGVGVSSKGKGSGRKEEVLGLLKEGIWSIKDLGVKFGISNRNVSSIVCYLRDDGYEFREIKMGESKGLVLWSVIRKGVKVGNRVEVGEKGKVVKFNFDERCFEDEIKKVEVVEEVEEVEKKK